MNIGKDVNSETWLTVTRDVWDKVDAETEDKVGDGVWEAVWSNIWRETTFEVFDEVRESILTK